ncbi:DUF4349 domain-containing protein [Streptomyces sp. ME08-AFT2]|uniref:DUF4349 domain-containing protein n=1 Tax=Streptomyces sp. ME08-AFT2 TaxID=3028683 RepID=UPI0029AD913F|nr:DUF4349 domain-containing protein [Streptomyces sp. ME08-AFT2]MDX3312156.1 DUF4349 domain-containing protein [Streptomyces sp. ME08-AFT2]
MRTRRSAGRPARRSARPAHALAGLLLAVGLTLAGCSGAGDESGSAASDKAAAGEAAPQDAGAAQDADAKEGAGASGSKATAAPRPAANRIIRTATLTVQVKDVSKALDEARTTTENAGGYVGDETTVRDEDDAERTRVVLRIPVEKYDDVLAGLQGAGKLLERTAKAQDVTDQVVDVESRIASQRVSVARVRELMDRAVKLSDVVTLEGELSNREAALEALLAQQASLKDRTSLATITLTLAEKPVVEAVEDDDPGFVDAVTGGWGAFVTVLRWIAVAFGATLPFLAAGLLLLLVWLRLVRPRRRAAEASWAGLSVPGQAGAAQTGAGQAGAGRGEAGQAGAGRGEAGAGESGQD